MAEIYKLQSLADTECLRGAACAFGVFDGVHCGHRFVIERMAACARRCAAASAIITFDRDPDELFHGRTLKKLMSNGRRVNALAQLPDVDVVAVIPFTPDVAAVAPDAFLQQCFAGHTPSSLHVGVDFRFGARAAGTLDTLRAWGDAHGMQVHPYNLLERDGLAVTSTHIRALLAKGAIEQANGLLDGKYTVEGTVQHGRGEGSDMGFCTANLDISEQLRVLGDGVYAAYAHIGATRYRAAASVGVSPTFADQAKANMEIHILDFEGDLYGRAIQVAFTNWLRPMMAFSSTEELIATVMGNIEWVRANLPL